MADAYEVHREIEIKLDLESFTNYLKLMGFLGQVEHEDQHINAFFDTEDRQLAKAGWGLRVRAEGARGLVTLKGERGGTGPARIRDEIEAEVRRGEAMDVLNLRKDIMSFFIPPIDYVRKEWGDIKVAKLVHFESTRQKKPFRIGDYNYVLELDKTQFIDGSVDYELELELPDESLIVIVEDNLRKLFASLDIPFKLQTESKMVRALKKAGML
jgi:uncharacterized protein YjbK